ncbi:TetR/AcrR family transcriptional regulator [Rhodococcus aerolatus]
MTTHGVTTPPATARGRATRDRIVAAAAALAQRRGVLATSLDDVRRATSTSKSQLYHYFPDKSGLVGTVVDAQADHVLATQQPALGEVGSMAGLRAWRDHVIALCRGEGPQGGCPLGRLGAELAEVDDAARARVAAGFDRWRAALTAGLATMQRRGELAADADAEHLALGLLAAVQGGLLLAQVHRSTTPLEAALDLALAGIAEQVGA